MLGHALERLRQGIVKICERHADENDPEVYGGVVMQVRRHVEKPQQRICEYYRHSCQDNGEKRARDQQRRQFSFQSCHIFRAEEIAHEDAGSYADAGNAEYQDIHHRRCHASCGKRTGTYEMSCYHGIHHVVGKLKQISEDQRYRIAHKRAHDTALRHIHHSHADDNTTPEDV